VGYIREITIDAPVETVWQALSTPHELARWLAPHVDHVDFREGGAFELSWGEGGDTAGCHIVAIRPTRSIQFEWRGKHEFDDLFAPPMKPTVVEVRLDARDGATHVAVEQPETRHGRAWAAYDEWMAESWEEKLQALRRECEAREDSPYFRE
jgi:uncharacterized protein YndB with AHSA1/START domain